MTHDDKPEVGQLKADEIDALGQMRESDYFRYIERLMPIVRGKLVKRSETGRAGFLLTFDDDAWVVSFVEAGTLRYEVGGGPVPQRIRDALDSSVAGDASGPLPSDVPYASEKCDMATEIANAHGKPITGVAIGESCFNFCFPGGRELETMLVDDATGRPGLRVFWEQW